MTYYITQEEDYEFYAFGKSEKIKSESIENAIRQYVKDYCKMDQDGENVSLYIMDDVKHGNIMKYTITCEHTLRIKFDCFPIS